MSDLISRKALIEFIDEYLKKYRDAESLVLQVEYETLDFIKKIIDVKPVVETFPKAYVDQIRWERDVAIEQLNEIGCGFGQKMDEVKKKLEVVHGKWIFNKYYSWECGNCGFNPFKGYIPKEPGFNYCPNCGCDMRTSAE